MVTATSVTYPCPTCQKTFKRKGDLNRHKALHDGYKPHECKVCHKRFSQLSGLNTHMNTHTRAKPHKCDFCHRRFGDPSSCSRHRKETHLSRGGYVCPVPDCNTTIKRRSAFATHLEKHGENPHAYDLESMCPKPFDPQQIIANPELVPGPSSAKQVAVDAAIYPGYGYNAYYENPSAYAAAYPAAYDPAASYPWDYQYYSEASYLPAPLPPYAYQMPADAWDQSSSSASPTSSRESSSGPSSLDQSPAPFAELKLRHESPEVYSASAPLEISDPYVGTPNVKHEENPVDLLDSDGFDEFTRWTTF